MDFLEGKVVFTDQDVYDVYYSDKVSKKQQRSDQYSTLSPKGTLVLSSFMYSISLVFLDGVWLTRSIMVIEKMEKFDWWICK